MLKFSFTFDFSAEEIEQFGKSDLLVLSEMLGDKVVIVMIFITTTTAILDIIFHLHLSQEFFFGDEPALLDLVVYAHVAQLVKIMIMRMIMMMMKIKCYDADDDDDVDDMINGYHHHNVDDDPADDHGHGGVC